MANVIVDVTHQKNVTAADDGDSGHIQGTDWNARHVVNPATFLSALGISIVTGDPNGTSNPGGPSGPRALAWDQTNSQLWINTDGGTTWTPFVRADGGTAQARRLFALWTDSNGMGAGANTFESDPANATAVPNANVTLVKKYTTNFSEPVTPFDMGTGSLRAENIATTPGYGPELSIGAVLDELLNGPGASPDSAHKLWLAQFSIHSSKLADWMQASTAGTLSPLLGGGNLDADSSNQAATAAAASGRTLACAFTMLCTNDASDATATANIPTNVPAFIARKRAVHGSQLLFVWVVMQSTLPPGTFTQVVTARANQIAALQAATGTAIVYAEDIPTIDDLAHFVAIGETLLGQRQAFAYVRLAGLTERAVTVPTVVGFSPATWNGSAHGECGFTGVPGANLRAWPWQGGRDGDVMFMPVFTGAIGAGSTIPTPSGWSPAATQVSSLDAAGVGNQLALFTRNLAQTELDGNVPSTGGPGFPVTVTITPGGLQTVVKPFTVRGPGRFPAINGTPVTAAHTAVDTAAVTIGGVAATGAATYFLLVSGWSASGQSFAVANASLTGLTQVFGAQYPSSSGNFLYLALWQGRGSGTIGSWTATPTLNSSSQFISWAM